MPKIVDHAARRGELARVVWRLIGHSGVAAATVRAVAAESGWSMGAVRYYFSTHDELLYFAGEVMAQRIVTRVQGSFAAEWAGPRIDRAAHILEQLLPIDDDRRVEVHVWLAFMTVARTDPRFDELRTSGWAGERYLCRLAVADALELALPRSAGSSLATPELEDSAARVHVVIDGMSLQAVTYPEHWPPERLSESVRLLLEDEVRRFS
ncbi:MAG: TetR family transcriptional regulator C-terminal domain-containing protein [Micrococcales bacterium]|nr:TetR family transcriptional regulator C-terminal domain-containing protein [Micrococcales bacterium]